MDLFFDEIPSCSSLWRLQEMLCSCLGCKQEIGSRRLAPTLGSASYQWQKQSGQTKKWKRWTCVDYMIIILKSLIVFSWLPERCDEWHDGTGCNDLQDLCFWIVGGNQKNPHRQRHKKSTQTLHKQDTRSIAWESNPRPSCCGATQWNTQMTFDFTYYKPAV